MNFISMNLVTMLYLIASVCFIQALKGLSSPATARQGNAFGMTGMAIAFVTTIALILKLQSQAAAAAAAGAGSGLGLGLVALGVIVGGGIGAVLAKKVEIVDKEAVVTREVDGGLMTIAVQLPAVITTDLRLNEPRYAKLPDIMKARAKPLTALTPEALGVDITPRMTVLKVEEPAKRKGGGKVKDVAELVDKLRNEAKVI